MAKFGGAGVYHLLIASIMLLLAGCASGGPTGKEILTGSLQPEASRVVIYRTAIVGFAVQPQYMVNGKSVAPSQPTNFLVCDLSPGKHDIAVDNPSFNVNLGGGTDKVQVDLKPGETQFIRADVQMGLTIGVITLTEVKPSVGKAETDTLTKQPGGCAAGLGVAATKSGGAKTASVEPANGSAAKKSGARPGFGGDCPGYMHNGQSCTDAAGRQCTLMNRQRMCEKLGE